MSKSQRVRLNEAINASELRVISADGKQIGVMSKSEALAQARNVGLDLVEISPQANPPVVKIVDWGKFNYQKTKQEKKNRLKNRSDLKQMRLSLKIGQHDLDIKLRKSREFLEAGHSVRFVVRYRGRELAHRDLGYDLANDVAKQLADISVIDQEPKIAGRQLTMTLRSNGNAQTKDPQRNSQENTSDKDG